MGAPAAETTCVQTVSSSGTPEVSSKARRRARARGDRADRSGRAKSSVPLTASCTGMIVDIIYRADGIEGEAAHLHALGQIEPGRSGQNERQQQPKREKQAGQPQPGPTARFAQQQRKAEQDGKLQQRAESSVAVPLRICVAPSTGPRGRDSLPACYARRTAGTRPPAAGRSADCRAGTGQAGGPLRLRLRRILRRAGEAERRGRQNGGKAEGVERHGAQAAAQQKHAIGQLGRQAEADGPGAAEMPKFRRMPFRSAAIPRALTNDGTVCAMQQATA